MKVLFLTNELNTVDGVTTHLYNLIKGLSGYNDIELFLICGKKNTGKLDDLNVNIVENNIFLHEKRGYLNFLRAASFSKSFIKENSINLVHSHTHYAANIAKQAVKNRILTFQTNHGLINEKGKLKHFNADKYIAINEHIYEHLLNNNIAEKKDIYFIRCGIEIPVEPLDKQKRKLKILAASRLTRSKGLDIFIKAVGALNSNDKQIAEFSIAGTGDEKENLKKINNELSSGIIFLGKVENINEILKQSHIFVFAGRSSTEGFPASITEAAAHKNLVITSDFLGVNSVIINNIDGLIFEKENINELSDLLSKAINNYSNYIPIAETFYKKVKSLYNISLMAEKHYNMYKTCLAE